MTSLFSFFLNIRNRTVFISDLFDLIYSFINISFRYVLMISYSSDRIDINENGKLVSCISLITWLYSFLFFDNSLFLNSWKIFSTFFIYSGMRLMFSSLKSNIILTLFFSIQFLSRIMSLEIDLTYIIIYCCSSRILN